MEWQEGIDSEALAALAKGSKQWVSLQVNTKDETIEFVEAFDSLAAEEWPSKLPEDRPRYIFVASGEGAVSMVYYCPDAAPIKEKMLGSTVKASAQAQASGKQSAHSEEPSAFAAMADTRATAFTTCVSSRLSACCWMVATTAARACADGWPNSAACCMWAPGCSGISTYSRTPGRRGE